MNGDGTTTPALIFVLSFAHYFNRSGVQRCHTHTTQPPSTPLMMRSFLVDGGGGGVIQVGDIRTHTHIHTRRRRRRRHRQKRADPLREGAKQCTAAARVLRSRHLCYHILYTTENHPNAIMRTALSSAQTIYDTQILFVPCVKRLRHKLAHNLHLIAAMEIKTGKFYAIIVEICF